MGKKDQEKSGVAPRAAAQLLESLGRSGVTHIAKRRAARAAASDIHEAPATSVAPPIGASTSISAVESALGGAVASEAASTDSLEIIRQEIAACVRCPELAASRANTVPGVGNPKARLCFFGEAPGADEDAQGIPFVGRAGQLLTKIIQACQLSRDDVFILNVLKCRPPGNRTPSPDEVVNCRGFFERQFRLIQPEFICCLGATAAQSLLQTTQSIGRLRGQFFDYGGAQVICTFHPSYLLRNPAAKKDVWEDMKMLMRRMGVELS